MTDWTRYVGAGWHNIVKAIVEMANEKGFKVVQVKEKFGELRVYLDTGDEEIYAFITEGERLSLLTCETCGGPGRIRNDKGWMKTRCDKHA